MLTRYTLIFLYNPKKISPQHYYTENLGIQYIGAVLRKAHFDVQIINADYEELTSAEIVRLVREFKTDFLGMAPCYITMKDTLKIAHSVKREMGTVFVCLGGHHATFCADDILKNEEHIDFIVRGEGEETIVELANAIESCEKKMPPIHTLESIKGLSFWLGNMVFHNEPRQPIENLDAVPFPVRDPLDSVSSLEQHAMPLLCTSRGCPGNCSFCSTPRFYGRRWRARSAVSVVDEIQEIIERYGLSQFYLTDDEFTGHGEDGKRRVENVINEIKRRRLHKDFDLYFFIMVRAAFFCKENEDVIRQFPEVGFRDIFVGFESADDSQLKLYRKGVKARQYHEAIAIMHRFNLFVEGGFIIFNPYTSFDSLKKDAAFIKQLGVPLFGYYTKELMVLPGTRLFEQLVEDGLMVHHSYKQIQFRYQNGRIESLNRYLQEFLERFEEADNRLFETIDFGAKLLGRMGQLSNNSLRQKAESFIIQSNETYDRITDLNYEFFNSVAETFELGGTRQQRQALEQKFMTEHSRLSDSVFWEYRELNSDMGIIRLPAGKQS